MSSHRSNAVRYLSVLSRARRRRARKPIERVAARRNEPRPARAPHRLTLSSRRIPRQTMPEAVVPYLRMSGRWLEEHGFAIGADVQVVVEQSRVTLISRQEDEGRRPSRRGDTDFSRVKPLSKGLNLRVVDAESSVLAAGALASSPAGSAASSLPNGMLARVSRYKRHLGRAGAGSETQPSQPAGRQRSVALPRER